MSSTETIPTWRKNLSRMLFVIGLAGYAASIFYGVPLHWREQRERQKDLQALANPDLFTQEEKEQIAHEVTPYLERGKRAFRRMDPSRQLWMGVQLWVEATVRYDSDLRQFGTLEYMSNAREVWLSRREDCDGRAVLAAAVLKILGKPEAKVAVNKNHAEVSLTSDALPEPTPKAAETKKEFKQRLFLERLPERIASIPWGRAAIGVIWYWLCGLLAHRIIREKIPPRVALEILGMFIFNCAMEIFAQIYLLRGNL
jgi:hypothetical protein